MTPAPPIGYRRPISAKAKRKRQSPAAGFLIILAILAAVGAGVYLIQRPRRPATESASASTDAPPAAPPPTPAPAPSSPPTGTQRTATPAPQGPLDLPPLAAMVQDARARFDAAKTERAVEDTHEAVMIGMANNLNLSQGQKMDFAAAMEVMRKTAFKRVELPGVTLVKAFIRRGHFKRTGEPYQEIAITFKNTGTAPVSEVWGTFLVFGPDGIPIEGNDKMCFFAAETPAENIPVGGTYTDPAESGHIILSKKVAKGHSVKIEKVIH